MNILLTGVSGFVGRNTARYLIGHGHNVIGVCRRNVEEKLEGVNYIRCDLSKPINIDLPIDAIVHLAGQVEDSVIDTYVDNTILAMRNLISLSEKKNISRFIFASTVAVYGEVHGVVNEQADKTNLNTYALTKLMAERMLEESHIKNKIIVRLPRVLGEGLDYSFSWIPKLTKELIFDEPIRYFNPWMTYNNLLHVEDFACFCNQILVNDKLELNRRAEIIGLASDVSLTIKDVIDIIAQEVDSKSVLIETKRTGINTAYWIDITRAVGMGFRPRSAEQSLREFANISVEILKGEKKYVRS